MKWCEEAPHLSKLKIPRCILDLEIEVCSDANVEIHAFSDASSKAYGAAVYIKVKTRETVSVNLMASKSRVAPLKSISLPRLELMGALLAARLCSEIKQVLDKKQPSKRFFWTDSKVTLYWIQSPNKKWKPFVSNRVKEIQTLTSDAAWHHCPGKENPADMLTRGVSISTLVNSERWLKGPDFLRDKIPEIATEIVVPVDEYKSELKKNFCLENSNDLVTLNLTLMPEFLSNILNLSNNYVTVIRIVSYVFRFIRNLRNPKEKCIGPLEVEEIRSAETFLVKSAQHKDFKDDLRDLRQQGRVQPQSKLKSLNPFVDSDGILRVGGRLGNSNLPFNQRHPAILSKSHRLTFLIILNCHLKYFHVGASTLLSLVREKFWPLSARSVCRKIVHNCIICFKAKPVISSQLMGNLPKERVTVDFPFNCSGVDLCGPFWTKYKNQRKGAFNKVYVCIFVCFMSKAVHIEIISDLTSESFIATLKRFVARRGKCAKLFSDNAKNFVGADKQLKAFLRIVRNPDEKLSGYLSTEGIEWKFIPPRAPNFGGLWEAAIKSFKYHFKRVVGGAKLTYEELLTVITQIEGLLNSRPLCPVSASEEDLEVLTPAHFLIGRSLNSIIEPDLTNILENRLKKWQRLTKIVQLIWKKWHRSYLSNLQQRGKWRIEKDNVKIGDLVLIVEDNLPPLKWSMGRITNVYYGNDNKIRVVQLKTEIGTCKRSISKICVLPMPEE